MKQHVNINGQYNEIFTEKISEEISDTLLKITTLRENMKLSPEGGPSALDTVQQTDT